MRASRTTTAPQGVDVREYSIGDYVLNGGEVAVSVMLEAITRPDAPDSWAARFDCRGILHRRGRTA